MLINLMKKKVCFHDNIDEKRLIICAFLSIYMYDLSTFRQTTGQTRKHSTIHTALQKMFLDTCTGNQTT